MTRENRWTLGFATFACVAAFLSGGCDGAEGTPVGPRGGDVRSDDGRVTLHVPAEALVDTVSLSLVRLDVRPEGAIGPAYGIEPFGLTFALPAMITYDVSDRPLRGDDTQAVRLVTERDHGWDTLADRHLDDDGRIVTGSVVFAAAVGAVQSTSVGSQ